MAQQIQDGRMPNAWRTLWTPNAVVCVRCRIQPFGNKLATTLAMSTQCGYNVNWCRLDRNHLQFKVFQRHPNITAS